MIAYTFFNLSQRYAFHWSLSIVYWCDVFAWWHTVTVKSFISTAACAKIWSNLRAIASYRANLKPSVVSNTCTSLASKPARQLFKKGVLLFISLAGQPLATPTTQDGDGPACMGTRPLERLLAYRPCQSSLQTEGEWAYDMSKGYYTPVGDHAPYPGMCLVFDGTCFWATVPKTGPSSRGPRPNLTNP